jgi:hypothetical protein
LGLGSLAGNLLHWSVAAGAAAATLWTWHKTKDGFARVAVLAAATLLVTPYLRAYDLALLILPAAVLLRAGSGPLDKIILFAAWLAPGLLMFISPPVQFGGLVSLLVLAAILWNAKLSPLGSGAGR